MKLSYTDQSALSNFAQRLIQTASFSGMEGSIAQLIVQELTDIGLSEIRIDDMGNVVARIGSGVGPHLLMYAHMDTVGIGEISAWERDPFDGQIAHGNLYGRGAADPKGAIAALAYSTKILRQQHARLPGTLHLAFGVQAEPAEGAAIRYLIETEGINPDWVVLAAPTQLNLYLGHRGRVQLKVTVLGKACHAGAPERGINAINGAARIIFSLEMMSTAMGNDPVLGAGTLAVTHIENIERTKNVIPDRCTFFIDRRLTVGETEAQAIAEVQSLLAREGLAGSVEIMSLGGISYTGYSAKERKSYPAWSIDTNASMVKQVSKAVQRATGSRPQTGYWRYATAGVYTMGYAGIPTLGFGPGNEKVAHTANEHVPLRDCYTAAAGYAHIAASLLK